MAVPRAATRHSLPDRPTHRTKWHNMPGPMGVRPQPTKLATVCWWWNEWMKDSCFCMFFLLDFKFFMLNVCQKMYYIRSLTGQKLWLKVISWLRKSFTTIKDKKKPFFSYYTNIVVFCPAVLEELIERAQDIKSAINCSHGKWSTTTTRSFFFYFLLNVKVSRQYLPL